MNVELARKALDAARRHPERFEMGDWFAVSDTGGRYPPAITIGPETRVPPCGTTACFAGWVVFMTAPEGTVIKDAVLWGPDGERMENVEKYAAGQLGITLRQAGVLFYLDNIKQVTKAIDYLEDNPGASGDALYRESGLDEWHEEPGF